MNNGSSQPRYISFSFLFLKKNGHKEITKKQLKIFEDGLMNNLNSVTEAIHLLFIVIKILSIVLKYLVNE